MAEEWGLNCSYNDMNTFELSEYGIVKKNFINNALRFRGIEAKIPFALVIPKRYACYEINRKILDSPIGENSGVYMDSPLNEADAEYFGHIEDLTKLFFAYYERTEGDNEDHVITNTRFGDVVDIIYEDASDEALARYDYLIDASPDGAFAAAKAEFMGFGTRIAAIGTKHSITSFSISYHRSNCVATGEIRLLRK